MAARKTHLCCVRGRYRRTIGKFVNSRGRLAPRKFLLGTDRAAAERANLRLEQLWDDIVRLHHQQQPPEHRPSSEPIWTDVTLCFAEAIRKGRRIVIPDAIIEREVEITTASVGLALWYHDLRTAYPSIADLLDEPQHSAVRESMEHTAGAATLMANLAQHYAEAARRPTAAAPPGQTLYAALDAWGEACRAQNTRADGTVTETGRKLHEAAERLKHGGDDIPLDRLDYAAVQAMVEYWCGRPPARDRSGRSKGRPITVVTVRNMLSYLKRFFVWLHRNNDFVWRDTDRIIEDAAGRRSVRVLMTPEERKKAGAGPDTWTLDELVTLYRYATDHERLYLLLGLNGGFAQSEIIHLAWSEVMLDEPVPHVQYIRHKSAKPGGFVLWPETAQGLRWARQGRAHETWALVAGSGRPLTRQRIANAWQKLLSRVRQVEPRFRALPFKYLRKTSAELVLTCGGDAQIVAIMQGRAKRTAHDDQADVYYKRRFEDVHRVNLAMREHLQPMFDAVPEIFTGRPGRRGKVAASGRARGPRRHAPRGTVQGAAPAVA